MKVIRLRLYGLLQSYSKSPMLYYKRTELYPTKSAVVGIIGAALGIRRSKNQRKKLKEISEKIDLFCENKFSKMFASNQMSKYFGNFNIIDDFVTVSGLVPKMVDGTLREPPTMVKEYICDNEFVVYVRCEDEEFLQEISQALLYPVYQLYLGRKSCPPSKHIYDPEDQDFLFEEVEEQCIYLS